MLVVRSFSDALNRFLNMPETLFVLRMNEEGSGFDIEEHQIDGYPRYNELVRKLADADGRVIKASDIREWGFGELTEEMLYSYDGGGGVQFKRSDDNANIVLSSQFGIHGESLQTRVLAKRVDLTLSRIGRERMVHYSLEKAHVEREAEVTRKSLEAYKNHTDYVWRKLKEFDSAHVEKKEDKQNIELCGISTFFYYRGRKFIKVGFRLGHTFRTDPIFTVYDMPLWSFEHLHNGFLSVGKGKELKSEQKSFEEWMDEVLKEPDDAIASKECIAGQIEESLGKKITVEDVGYNPLTNCYHLENEVEAFVLSDLMPEKDESTAVFAKYTTLDTLLEILKSGKMRMNSIVSMNDKTETDFLGEYIKNFKEDIEEEYDKYLFADKEFITSFTSRIDDLDMWRLYGDNARGVCMVFGREKGSEDDLYHIRYIDPESDAVGKLTDVMDKLKGKSIKFHFVRLDECRHYLKHKDYESEDELRLLRNVDEPDGWYVNRENGILTPYIEMPLCKSGSMKEGDYPFRLRKIIIGPAMREGDANLMQVFCLAHHYKYSLAVQESAIRSYR